MTESLRRICTLAERQHGAVAVWQMRRMLRLTRGQIHNAERHLRRVFHGVYALGDLDEAGWYMAAALAGGPRAAVSHRSAVMLLGLRPHAPGAIHVSVPSGGREDREGLILHRRHQVEAGHVGPIPVTSPSQSLKDADLQPHEFYRALEEAKRREYALTLPLSDVVCLQQAVRGRTRSDTEARFILLCHEGRLPLPRVNQHLNGFETDFHWPREKLVVEVDGYEHHREREQFNRDRYRGLVHRTRGWEVIRVSADDVYDRPRLVEEALRQTTGW